LEKSNFGTTGLAAKSAKKRRARAARLLGRSKLIQDEESALESRVNPGTEITFSGRMKTVPLQSAVYG